MLMVRCCISQLFLDDVKCSSGTAANCAACGASCAGNDCKWDSGTSTCVVLGKSIDTCIYILGYVIIYYIWYHIYIIVITIFWF